LAITMSSMGPSLADVAAGVNDRAVLASRAVSLDVAFLGAAQQAALVRRRQLSPVELVDVYLDRIDRLDERLRAYITVCRETARQAAGRAEEAVARGGPLGPLHGVAFAVKDQFATRGVRTTAGSRILADNVPDEDATVVARLTAAGGILLGKLNLTEFALGGTIKFPFGQPRNPWNPEHDTGGSSAGSGVAVAAALCSVSLGEDTGGSVRSPASWCGVAGHRPTWGLVSRHGCIPLSWSHDTPGPLGRTVEDCALLLGIIAGQDPRDSLTTRRPVPDYAAALTGDVRGLRVGVIRELTHGAETDREVRDAVTAAASVLAGFGAEVDEVSLPLVTKAGAAFMAICDSEGAAFHLPWLRSRPADYDEGTRRRLLAASLVPAVLLHKAQQARALIRQQMHAALAHHDVLVAPTAHRPAPAIASFTAPITSKADAAARFFTRRSFTTPAALAGNPALAVPCGFSREGLPLSLQIIGRRFDDATVLRVGHAYEQATDWHRRRPAL
jgi:aspartyl-tRNA(Asn)/glutamyl-tRNA(Gln) amidotransferase subunit A